MDVSTDQNYVGGGGRGGGRMGYQHEQMHERRIPVRDRFVPFLAPFLMTFVVVPGVELISWGFCKLWVGYLGMVVIGWCVTGSLVAVVSYGIGRNVSKRVPWVYVHVTITSLAWGYASAFTTAYGLWTTPPWLVVHAFGSLLFALSWVLYRIDSLRSAAANNDAKNYWGEVIGLRSSHPRKITPTPTGIEIEIDHGPGETRSDVQAAAKKLESAMDAVAGRTTVTDVASGRAGSSLVRLSLVDVFRDWWEDPGPSHPGMSFAYPLRTGYYETGEWEWFSFASSLRSPHTDFASEMDTFLGAAGTTGSGKSGGINNTAREALTRCDAIVCWLDRAKIEQNAGWCLDMLGMAGNDSSAKAFTLALRKLAEYRVKLFGQVALSAALGTDLDSEQGRKWTAELAQQTGEAAVLVIVDEADTAIQGTNWEWLSARGRSLGIFLLAATPRASAAEVPALVRGSIGAWKTYAIGDNYSDGFTLSAETMDAGADPKRLRSPGLHYLDRAPGVDLRHCATLAREFRTSPGRLRASVLKYRGVTFQPMGFSRGAIDAMGDSYRQCNPARLLPGWQPPARNDELPEHGRRTQVGPDFVQRVLTAVVDGSVASTPDEMAEARRILTSNGVQLPAPQAGPGGNMTSTDRLGPVGDEDDQEDDEDMRATAQGTDEEAGIARPIDPRSLLDDDQWDDFQQANPSMELPVRDGPEMTFEHAKPVWESDAVERELDHVIVLFKRTGKTTFTNSDVLEAMRCYFDPSTCSRRLEALSTGSRTAPGGLGVTRTGRGEFEILGELDESYQRPRPHRPEGN